jgi:hypothetical protein
MNKITLVICALMSGCQIMPPVQITTEFNPTDHTSFLQTGNSKIKGQAFLKQNGGAVVTCAGNLVYLTPDTQYFREVFDIAKQRRRPKDDLHHEEKNKYVRKTQCDAQGNFEYSDLPENNWIIATEVKWVVGYSSQGGGLLRSIKTIDNQTITIILSGTDKL